MPLIRSPQAASILSLMSIVGVGFVLRSAVVDVPLERDEGQYAYIAWRWLQGGLPYVESFDQKPPGIYAVYAAILAMFGNSPEAIRWCLQVWLSGAAVAIYLLGRQIASRGAGLAGAAFLTLLTVDRSYLANAANTELFMLLPIILSVAAAVHAARSGSLAASAAAGGFGMLGCLFKQVAAFDLVYALLVVAICGERRRAAHRIVAAGAGSLSILVPVILWFHTHAALGPLYEHVIAHNLDYAGRVSLAEYPRAFWQSFAPTLWPLGPIYALVIASAWRPGPSAAWRLLAGWLFFSILGVASGGYFREHYFLQAVPAASLLAGLAAVALPSTDLDRPRRAAISCVLVAAALAMALFASRAYYLAPGPAAVSRLLYGDNPFPESALVARYIAERTEPDDPVFVFGSEPQILFLAERRSATRYVLVYPLYGPFSDAEARQNEALQELRRELPPYIVVTTAPSSFLASAGAPRILFRGLRELLSKSYRPVAIVPGPLGDRLVELSESDASRLSAGAASIGNAGVWGSLSVWRRRD